jgi:hypothetical protein
LITTGGRSAAATDVAKRAPPSNVAAIEPNPVDFMVVICICFALDAGKAASRLQISPSNYPKSRVVVRSEKFRIKNNELFLNKGSEIATNECSERAW